MKKTLEDELMSLAHRVLQLRGREDIDTLKDAAGKLYEKLAVLAFAEQHFDGPQPTIGKADVYTALDDSPAEPREEATPQPLKTASAPTENTENTPEEPSEDIAPIATENTTASIAELSLDETSDIKDEPVSSVREETKEVIVETAPTASDSKEEIADPQLLDDQNQTPSAAVDFRDFAVNYDDLPQFEPARHAEDKTFETPKHSALKEDVLNSVATPDTPLTAAPDLFSSASSQQPLTHNAASPQKRSLNETLSHGLKFGLNDRIVFTKHLFEGNQIDFDRVVSQLNTLNSFHDAKSFIETQIKPDYDWSEKTAIEERFYMVLEKRLG